MGGGKSSLNATFCKKRAKSLQETLRAKKSFFFLFRYLYYTCSESINQIKKNLEMGFHSQVCSFFTQSREMFSSGEESKVMFSKGIRKYCPVRTKP